MSTTQLLEKTVRNRVFFGFILFGAIYLFYQENWAINTTVGTLFFLTIGHWCFGKAWQKTNVLILQLLWVALSIQVGYSGAWGALTMWFFTAFAVGVSTQLADSSPFLSQIHYLFSFFVKPIKSFLGVFIQEPIPQTHEEKKNHTKEPKWVAYVMIGMVVFIFILLYRGANPVFNWTISSINLDFIRPELVGFIFFTSLLIFSWLKVTTIKPLGNWQSEYRSQSKPVSELWAFMSSELEFFMARTLFVTLNLVVLVVNLGDLFFLVNGRELPEGFSYSQYVHDGVGALIFSICLAILLILYFFRKRDGKFPKLLVNLAVFWLAQNLIMLVFTAYRNSLYIQEYSLTYKRLGVYLYLAMAAVGLIITIINLRRGSSFSWLFNRVDWALFLSLGMFFTVDWAPVITSYNISKSKKINEIDWYYLVKIGPTNTHQIQHFKPYFDDYGHHRFDRTQGGLMDVKNEKSWKSKTIYHFWYEAKYEKSKNGH